MWITIPILFGLIYSQACPRITYRKEINTLTDGEWRTYIDTIRRSKELGIWERAAQLHNTLNVEIHHNCLFFFWHRYFLADMERQLQTINPNFFFPYWDSARESNSLSRSRIWQYVGTFGNPVNGGVFGTDLLSEVGQRRPLARNIASLESLNGRFPSVELYSNIFRQSLANGGFERWAVDMEIWHGTLHVQTGGPGGQLSGMFSPLDPLFYTHHAHMDLLWVQAQAGWMTSNLGPNGQFGGTTFNGGRCSPNTPIPGYPRSLVDVVDTRNLCVEYLVPGQQRPISTSVAITSSSKNAIPTISRTNIQPSTTRVDPNQGATSVKETSIVKTLTNVEKGIMESPDGSTGCTTVLNRCRERSSNDCENICTSNKQFCLQYSSLIIDINLVCLDYSNWQKDGTFDKGSIDKIETSATSVAPLPTTMTVVDLPSDYTPMKQCPPPLPDSWLEMMSGGQNVDSIKTVANNCYNECEKLLKQLQSGYQVPVMPNYNHVERPCVNFTKVQYLEYQQECDRNSSLNGQPYQAVSGALVEQTTFIGLTLSFFTYVFFG
ncbi:hypothetical protein BC833DRAFT_118686 [Globomyces pollinis-pini]|nr:hypothetical protein BC833DRAFT_118686 [Globomyces pollinis-pini]